MRAGCHHQYQDKSSHHENLTDARSNVLQNQESSSAWNRNRDCPGVRSEDNLMIDARWLSGSTAEAGSVMPVYWSLRIYES
jgi:hypothetical protein